MLFAIEYHKGKKKSQSLLTGSLASYSNFDTKCKRKRHPDANIVITAPFSFCSGAYRVSPVEWM